MPSTVALVARRASGPRAEQSAAVVVDVHLAIGIDDPGLVTRDRAGRTARGGVASVQAVRLDRHTADVVLIGQILRGVVDDVELGRHGRRRLAVDDVHLAVVREPVGVNAAGRDPQVGVAVVVDIANPGDMSSCPADTLNPLRA